MTEGRTATVSRTYPIRLTRNHNFPAQRIRQLIQDALVPLPTDPIPSTILINNIVITQIDTDNIEITCDVLFEVSSDDSQTN